jgi:predicted CoA-binding protein
MNTLDESISLFLSEPAIAVVGASSNPEKYGHKVFACYLQKGHKAYPINQKDKQILGHDTYPDLAALPEAVKSISIITPPSVTEKVVEEAIAYGVKNIWMQPGAESEKAIKVAQHAGINVIHSGPCILVTLGYKE